MPKVGLVAIDGDNKWVGGRYYLHHLVKSVSSLPSEERIELRSIIWGANDQNEKDAFSEVRSFLGASVGIRFPQSIFGRVFRRIRRFCAGTFGASDLFKKNGIDAFFPIPPCENSGIPYVFWLPDFQYLRRPDLMSETARSNLERYYFEHVHAASQIVLSSEDAQRDFAKVYPLFLDRTHVVRFCSIPDSEWWRLDPSLVADGYGLPDRFLIVCNQFTRHKNHLVLMKALNVLSQRGLDDIHLVCTGSTFDHRHEDYIGQVNAYLTEHGLERRVHILGLIPRAEQIALLRRSIAVVQPSLFEGWSTIVEDAKTLGKPILVSDLPVHHEQLGPKQGYYIGLDSPDEWADAMAETWTSLSPGPAEADEANALIHLEGAKRECGLAFVKALLAALPLR